MSSSTKPPLRGGDPTLASSSATTEEEFLQVLDEMHRICGGGGNGGEYSSEGEEEEDCCHGGGGPGSNSDNNNGGCGSNGPPSSGSPNFESSILSTSPLEPLFGGSEDAAAENSDHEKEGHNEHDAARKLDNRRRKELEPPPKQKSSSSTFFVDGLAGSLEQQGGSNSSSNHRPPTSPRNVLYSLSPQQYNHLEGGVGGGLPSSKSRGPASSSSSSSNKPRSRHCSTNSSLSCVSFDSAIGDVYSVQTPPQQQQQQQSTTTTTQKQQPPSTVHLQQQQQSNATSFEFDQDLLEMTPSLHARISSPHSVTTSTSSSTGAASTTSTAATPYPHSGSTFSGSYGRHNVPMMLPTESYPSPSHHSRSNGHGSKNQEQQQQQLRRRQQHHRHHPYLDQASSPPHTPVSRSSGNLFQRQEVEMVCLDLLRRFQHASSLHPKQIARAWISRSGTDDPLLITTRLLSDALTRLRIFLFGLEPVNWLPWPDRHALYSSQVCCVAVLKASVGVDLNSLPAAYPLPYGEYLQEVEALHLILAHDLYNELRTLVSHLQQLEEIRELPVMLLVMMVAFFSPQPNLLQVEKVVRIHDYYAHKLQIYLSLRYGPSSSSSLMCLIVSAIDKVRHFSTRLREFMNDVTRCGLQRQYESVCENIGLMAFLLQSEPPNDQ